MNSYTGVIPVHNGEATIYEALLSLANQSIPPEKILVFDNNSNDSTLKEVQKFRKTTDIPLEIERSEKLLPPNESFASSIKSVKGRFLWLAADDMLFPWAAEKMLATRCGPACKHSLSGSSLFLNDQAEIIQGKIYPKDLDIERFLRDPADNSIFYGMHVTSEVKFNFPKSRLHAWDWYFSFLCVNHGVHFTAPFPTHFREYTPITSHRASATSQNGLRKYFPYFDLSKSILNTIGVQVKIRLIRPLIILNLKGFIVFGKLSEAFDRRGTNSFLLKVKRFSTRSMYFAKNNSLIRKLYSVLPMQMQKLIRKVISPNQNEFVMNYVSIGRLVEENTARQRSKSLSINNKIKDISLAPGNGITSAQIVEMARYFLKFADKNSKLVFDTRNTSINLDYAKTMVLGLKRLFPYADILFQSMRKKENEIQDIDEFYAKIWAADFDNDIGTTFLETKKSKNLEIRTVNFFLPEIPQPNRDAGSIDAIYILCILRRLGIETNVYLPHFVSTNSIARSTLKEFAKLELVENYKNNGGLNLVYGPYSYQNFEPYSFESDFVYIMVDAVFRREAQNKDKLSFSDKAVLEFERNALQNCRYALSISESDQDAVMENFPQTKALLFPIMRFARTIEGKNLTPPQNLLFIGSLVHTPNRIAAEWIVKELAPKLLMINPEIRLVLAGQGSEEFSRVHSNVQGLGMVSDLHSLYAESFATIAPMAVAAGVNGKVIESLCFQRPAIISEAVSVNLPQSLRGYCEVALNADEYAAIADKIFKGVKNNEKTFYTMTEVNAKSNIETLIKLLSEG
jgi:glycosyltransferase involved in cell wall biosynthesis